MRTGVSPESIDAQAELAAFSANGKAGALVSFTGFCRGTHGDQIVHWLELQHYAGVTERWIERLAAAAMSRHAIVDLLVLHRIGRILPGEAIVLVAALGQHRADAFAAVEQMMDYLKTDAIFWKREMRDDGAHWIEPTDEDRRRRAALGETP